MCSLSSLRSMCGVEAEQLSTPKVWTTDTHATVLMSSRAVLATRKFVCNQTQSQVSLLVPTELRWHRTLRGQARALLTELNSHVQQFGREGSSGDKSLMKSNIRRCMLNLHRFHSVRGKHQHGTCNTGKVVSVGERVLFDQSAEQVPGGHQHRLPKLQPRWAEGHRLSRSMQKPWSIDSTNFRICVQTRSNRPLTQTLSQMFVFPSLQSDTFQSWCAMMLPHVQLVFVLMETSTQRNVDVPHSRTESRSFSAFWHVEIDSRILVRPPSDLRDEQRNYCWTLRKAVHALRISPTLSSQLWRRTILGLGLKTHNTEPSVFLHSETDV